MKTTRVEGNARIESYWCRYFVWKHDPHAGFNFPCDPDGRLDAGLEPVALDNFAKCTDGTYAVDDLGVKAYEQRVRLCPCGSGKEREAVYDARNIFVAFVCPRCRERKLSCYRPEIFVDPQYECDEAIDADY